MRDPIFPTPTSSRCGGPGDDRTRAAGDILELLSALTSATSSPVWREDDAMTPHAASTYFEMDPDIQDRYRDEAWYAPAEQFVDELDLTRFDPEYPTEPRTHLEPLVRPVFAHPHSL